MPVLWTWVLVAIMLVSVFVTYARLDPERLYHVSESGVAGGAGRALVLLGFPIALMAVPIVAIVFDRLRRTPALPRSVVRKAAGLSVAAALLCATVAWPGMVDEADLDAKPANGLAAAGVLLALGLTGFAAALTRNGFRERPKLGTPRAVALAVLILAGLPWFAADLGVALERVPVLRWVFNADESAVHLGHHHGYDGVVLAGTALVFSLAVAQMARSRLRSLTAFYVSLQFVYGIWNALQDGWLEQVVKRGWTSTSLPVALHPEVTWIWGGLVLAALALWLGGTRRLRAGDGGRTDRAVLPN